MSCSAFELVRKSSAGKVLGRYKEVNAARFTLTRLGCMGPASITIDEPYSPSHDSWKGNEIEVSREGDLVYAGVVDNVGSDRHDLQLDAIGWWRALDGPKPTGFSLGAEGTVTSVLQPDQVISHLHGAELSASTITLGTLDSVTGPDIRKLTFAGKQSVWQAYLGMAEQAGQYAVGVDAQKRIQFRNMLAAVRVKAKLCATPSGLRMRATRITRQTGLNYTNFVTDVEVVGDGGFKEAFTVEQLGYPTVQVAGLPMRTRSRVLRPDVGTTASTNYTRLKGGDITVTSVDAALVADRIFAEQWEGTQRVSIDLAPIRDIFIPWAQVLRIYDGDDLDNGDYRIERIEYTFAERDVEAQAVGVKIA